MTGWKGLTGRLAVLLAMTAAAACGKVESAPDHAPAAPPAEAGGLSPFELEHGIGPVKAVIEVGPVDVDLARSGRDIYDMKCTACHKMGEKYVGPALGDVTTRRSPAFVMNMILNPQGMVERHPVGKQMLAEHMTFMANMSVTVEDARAILEYLRTQSGAAK